MSQFNVLLDDLNLDIFNPFRGSTTVVDYGFLQLIGEPYQPLRLAMQNGEMYVMQSVTAKITSAFNVAVQLRDILAVSGKLKGKFTCEIGDTALVLTNGRLKHTLTLIPNNVKCPTVNVSDETLEVNLANLVSVTDMDIIVCNPEQIIAFTKDKSTLKIVDLPLGLNFTLTPKQAAFLAGLKQARLVQPCQGQLHVKAGAVEAVLVESYVECPPVYELLKVAPDAQFPLSADEVAEIKTLIGSDVTFLVRDDTLTLISRDDNGNESRWVKSGVAGSTDIKLSQKGLKTLKSGAVVKIVSLGRVKAIRLESPGMIIFSAGLLR